MPFNVANGAGQEKEEKKKLSFPYGVVKHVTAPEAIYTSPPSGQSRVPHATMTFSPGG